MLVTLGLDCRRPWTKLRDLAAQAEAAGWDGVRVGDQPGGAECWAVVGALGATIARVRLEVVVDDGRGRHPAVVAKLASTVDRVSGGRLLLGLAPGADPDAHDRLVEAFRVVKGLVGPGPTTLAGSFYRLHDAPLEPKPQQRPFPLMLVGGNGDVAAQVADHWSLVGAPEEAGPQLAAFREACSLRGRDPSEVTISAVYPAAGVDEWIVPDALLGAGPDATLSRIAAEAQS